MMLCVVVRDCHNRRKQGVSELTLKDLGSRVSGFGFRVQGLGFRIEETHTCLD